MCAMYRTVPTPGVHYGFHYKSGYFIGPTAVKIALSEMFSLAETPKMDLNDNKQCFSGTLSRNGKITGVSWQMKTSEGIIHAVEGKRQRLRPLYSQNGQKVKFTARLIRKSLQAASDQ